MTFQTPQPGDTRHHEQTPSTQRSFAKDVIYLTSVIYKNWKSLLRRQHQPFGLDTKAIIPKIDIVQFIQRIGQLQHDSYVSDRLEKHTVAIAARD